MVGLGEEGGWRTWWVVGRRLVLEVGGFAACSGDGGLGG